MRKSAMLAATTLLCLSGAAMAGGAMQGDPMHGMHHEMSSTPMMGSHTMPATVTSINHKTGMVHVTAEGMKMAVHFPPPAIAKLKDGDKIELHLSYSMAH